MEETDDELGIKRLQKEVSETNKKLDDAYDEKLRRLDAKKKLLPDADLEDSHGARIAGLNEKVKELKGRISDARRAGKDPFMADLFLKNANAKIKLADVTREERDFADIEQIIKRAESELKEALAEPELNVKKEIESKLRETIAKETGKALSEDE